MITIDIRYGFVEKLLLALHDLGLISTVKRGTAKTEKRKIDSHLREENKIITLFLDGSSVTKANRIYQARKNLGERDKKDISRNIQRMDADKKLQLLKEVYLHIYLKLSHSIEVSSLSILTDYLDFRLKNRPLKHRRFDDLSDGAKEDIYKIEGETLLSNLRFIRQVTDTLRKRLQIPEEALSISALGTQFNKVKEVKKNESRKLFRETVFQTLADSDKD